MAVFDARSFDGHEEIVFGSDPVSGLQTIIAIHSTALGPALGGTRFFPYQSEEDALEDVLRLSRAMSLKSASAGLDLGGGKAVIIGDPRKIKSERLWRAFGRIIDSLQGRYITAEDVGTSHLDMEQIRLETRWVTGVPKEEGGSGDPSPATARGLMRALEAVSKHLWDTQDISGRKVAVQGVGKVGSNYVERLVNAGCEVVVADVRQKSADRIVQQYGVTAVGPDEILAVDCDVLSPCSLGASLNEDSIPTLSGAAIVGSANNQLATEKDDERLRDRGILYAPDFVVNAGGLINVNEELRGYQVERARHAIDKIKGNTARVLKAAKKREVTPHVAALDLAKERIKNIGNLRLFRRSGDDRN